jgi:hypothetical protein
VGIAHPTNLATGRRDRDIRLAPLCKTLEAFKVPDCRRRGSMRSREQAPSLQPLKALDLSKKNFRMCTEELERSRLTKSQSEADEAPKSSKKQRGINL